MEKLCTTDFASSILEIPLARAHRHSPFSFTQHLCGFGALDGACLRCSRRISGLAVTFASCNYPRKPYPLWRPELVTRPLLWPKGDCFNWDSLLPMGSYKSSEI